ncbi:efflux RND transporter periplasmic adaptor subunit [Flammeovirga kamogawensis]|uniref:Efflux RND transporter periplasmic adaptor subunit n=1 Tax=Flammeovirga kamogawensis TaxID=373891 RepID=A0ABX8GWL9_9BACT|nr:efflux RND transporter periplasmic adaptor subunit [Flammeovirga kamogawensis]MBB6461245.1 Cu(I)/Ag(I) efflux system membrane fusion protein [Flammeovirga kamogawensis]QWG07804.1 efflux RND transporter periplasmic adaptor subunit [Flammeovirga kamogawensis]TRX69610.1 efflux RND transporter periplasmic adaptor subunit [Flammeovirga kamogawensis]
MEKYIKSYGTLVIVFVIGIFMGWLFFGGESTSDEKKTVHHEHTEDTFYTCSMHPQIHQKDPGDCPLCGMKLIPESSGASLDVNHITLSKSATALANIQTTSVEKTSPKKVLQMQGKIAVDERRTYAQASHIAGRIEKSYVNYIGEKVRKGQKLATLYSPQLVTAQREYFEAKKVKDSNPQLLRSAIEKLRLWKLSEKQIQEIDKSGKVKTVFDIRADISGVITQLNVLEGDHVMQGKILYEVADLSRLWVKFDAYESDLAWVKVGDKISFTVTSYPGETFTTKVSFIDPFINPKTRVASVRGNVVNRGQKLKPEMFVNGKIQAELPVNNEVIVVPKSSVMWTGPRSVVYVKVPHQDTPTFEMKEVVLGAELANSYIIKEGLTDGDRVVTQGTYTVDAAAQLKGKPSMISQKMGNESETTSTFEVSDQFASNFKKVYQNYLLVKDAFVASDDKRAEEFTITLQKSLNAISMHMLQGDAHMFWMKTSPKLKKNLDEMVKADNIDTRRRFFVQVSKELSDMIQRLDLSKNEKVYLMYCPMANDDLGASWLSDTKEVLNPYYGDMMLKCGEIKKEI